MSSKKISVISSGNVFIPSKNVGTPLKQKPETNWGYVSKMTEKFIIVKMQDGTKVKYSRPL